MRALVASVVAVGLGAWLSLADLLQPGVEDAPDETRYTLVGAVGIVLLVAIAGWHTLWVMPVATCALALVYAQWFWDEPAGIPSGTDSLGYEPTSVGFVMFVALPFAGGLLLLRALARWRGQPGP